MNNYRKKLPQLNGKFFLTDGGLETTLIFHHGVDLPHFASFDILNTAEGEKLIQEYFSDYIAIARKKHFGFVLESPTWRANRDWGYLLGYDENSLRNINKKSIRQLLQIREENETPDFPIVVSGCIGPRGDGYSANNIMSVDEATNYHKEQIQTLSDSGCDLISAFTINNSFEAIGITLAAKEYKIPIVIGLTLETDGKLPSGETLQEAIEIVDKASDKYPAYFMINCAHPTHFKDVLNEDSLWKNRIMAIRANASCKSHAELDESEYLDAGNKCDLAGEYMDLKRLLPNLKVIGGCCGTDHTHIEEICKYWE